MPVYEYRCRQGHEYERTEGFDAPREHSCQVCGATSRRRISVPAIIFKGPGFYSTDNRKSGGGRNGSSSSDNGTSETAKPSGEATPTPAPAPKVEAASSD